MNHSTSLVHLLVGILLFVTGVGASCPIDLQPPSVVVRYGDPVSITCTTHDSMRDSIGWEASEGGTGLQEVNNLTWAVKSLTDWNIAPKCFFNSLPDGPIDQCMKEPTIVLYTFPQNISIGSNLNVITEEEQHDFICDVHNVAPVQNLTVKWYKGDKVVFIETFNNTQKEPVSQISVYRFIPTRHDNGDKLRCEAHLDLAPEGPQLNVSSQELILNIHFGPDLQCSSNITEGETLEKLCSVQGNPTPNVQWLKDGKVISSSVPLSRDDSGSYRVEAYGSSITAEDLRVIVQYKPELKCPSSYTAVENAPLNLSCTVGGYPEPKVIWYKDGEEVDLKENLRRRDAGQYLITAFNSLATVNATVEIDVMYPPSQIVELEDSEVDVGASVTLKCASAGNPQPTYSWRYPRTSNVDEKNEDGVSLLHIHGADVHNMGYYTCHAQNLRGNDSKTVKVAVRGIGTSCPIELQPPSVVVRYGDPVSITCTTHESMREGIGWEASEGGRDLEEIKHFNWTVESLKNWRSSPKCNFTPMPHSYFKPCIKEPTIILYTFPQNISIRNNNSVITEKEQHDFVCDVHNVAPVQNLTVKWYRGDKVVFIEKFDNPQKEPVNQTSVYRFTPTRHDNGDKLRCEAHLDLATEGPQLDVSSQEFILNIHYPPSQIVDLENSEVEVGSNVTLKCSSVGNPQPTYTWSFYNAPNVDQRNENGVSLLHIHNADAHNIGSYKCHARNLKGNVYKEVNVTVRGAEQKCQNHTQIVPDRMVLEYKGKSANVTCTLTSSSNGNHVIRWEAEGGNKGERIWSPDTHRDWDPRPVCNVTTVSGTKLCEKKLDFTLYKTPDSISVEKVSTSDLANETRKVELKCVITNVAPAQSLKVLWYRGDRTFEPLSRGQLKLADCHPQNRSDCNIGDTRWPLNVSSTIHVKMNRTHKSEMFRCGARLMLESIQPNKTSVPLNVTLDYKPVINTANLQNKEPVFSGYTVDLVCEADGHPPPKIRWHSNSGKELNVSGNTITVSEADIYNCTATNDLGSASHVVKVIQEVDHLPLIAGLVAVTVIVISVVFVFIYSIYYTNTRMRRYNFKNPKLSAQNGNVAHNGWEMQFPMTKLS